MADCPTALLVDLTVAAAASPRTPARRTPRRTCTLRQATTPHTPQPAATESPMVVDGSGKGTPREEPRTESIELLDQQTFDFDLSLSPSSNSEANTPGLKKVEDDEEIFFGPVGHREKCISKNVEDENPDVTPYTSLTASQVAMLFKEAQTVAYHVKQLGTPQRKPSQKSSQSSQDSGHSPALTVRKRKLSAMDDVQNGKSPKTSIKTFKLDSPLATKIISSPASATKEKPQPAREQKQQFQKPASRGLKPPGSGLQRSASLRLPKSRPLVKPSQLPGNKEERPRVRHTSGPAVTPSRQIPAATGKRKTQDEDADHEQPAAAASAPRKLPRLGPKAPELLRPGTQPRKSLLPPASKAPTSRVLPKGPLKATAAMKSREEAQSSARRSLQLKGPGSQRVTNTAQQRRSLSSNSSTPGNTSSTKSRSGSSGTPVKQDKLVNPKRLLSSPSIAPRCSSSSSSNLSMSEIPSKPAKKSCLPTYGRNNSFSSSGNRSYRSSVSSNDSILSSPGTTEKSVSTSQPQSKLRRSFNPSQNKENSRLQSPATRLASKLKPLRISDNPRHGVK